MSACVGTRPVELATGVEAVGGGEVRLVSQAKRTVLHSITTPSVAVFIVLPPLSHVINIVGLKKRNFRAPNEEGSVPKG
jgi:hypothetical protein